jgi:hypothetical protein
MTTVLKAILEAFDALSDVERREAAVEIIRRMTLAHGELPEGVIVEAADALFCMIDAEEAANVGP